MIIKRVIQQLLIHILPRQNLILMMGINLGLYGVLFQILRSVGLLQPTLKLL